MTRWRSCAIVLLAAALLGLAPGDGRAQVYVENFDGPLPSVVLGGVLEFGADGVWSVRVDDGALELANTDAENAVRYFHLDRITYPGTVAPTPTTDATIEVAVQVAGDERAGAGIMARYDADTAPPVE